MQKVHLLAVAFLIASLMIMLAAPLAVSAAPLSRRPVASTCAEFYVVRPGDNLFRIASRFGTTVRVLQDLNGIANPNRIRAGQQLCVRPASQPPSGVWYTVQRGDTLSSIARRHGVRMSDIAAANNLRNPNQIYVGQRLWIPGSSGTLPGILSRPRAAIENVIALMQEGKAGTLSNLVPEQGLIIAPYAVGAPDRGLTGTALTQTLEKILQGANPKVVAYDVSGPGRVGMVVTGLNPVRVTPALGDPLTITSPAYLVLTQGANDTWQLWLVAVDRDGLLAQQMTKPPFEMWK